MTHKTPYARLSNKLFSSLAVPTHFSFTKHLFSTLHRVASYRYVMEPHAGEIPPGSIPHCWWRLVRAPSALGFCQAGLSCERNHSMQLPPAGKAGAGAKLIRRWWGMMLICCCLLPVWMKDWLGARELILSVYLQSCTAALQNGVLLKQNSCDWLVYWFQNELINTALLC